jgi:hypothetical protein
MSGREQQKAARSAEHVRLAEGSAGATGDWKLIGPYLAARVGRRTGGLQRRRRRLRYFPFDRRARAPIARATTA